MSPLLFWALNGLGLCIFLYSLWGVLVGELKLTTHNYGTETLAFDKSPLITSLITGGMWTIAFFLFAATNPLLVARVLSFVPGFGATLLSAVTANPQVALAAAIVGNAVLAYILRKAAGGFFASSDLDLPPEALQAWEEKTALEQHEDTSVDH